jgi:hypothetical protein
MRQRPPRVHLSIPQPSNPIMRSPIRRLLLGNIELGGFVFDIKRLKMMGPLYIDMRSAPDTQNIMPKILACPSRRLYLTSSVLKNVH